MGLRAGLRGSDSGGDGEGAADVGGEGDLFDVICTPGGGAQTVRLQLAAGWESEYSDEELLREIEARRRDGASARRPD